MTGKWGQEVRQNFKKEVGNIVGLHKIGALALLCQLFYLLPGFFPFLVKISIPHPLQPLLKNLIPPFMNGGCSDYEIFRLCR